ncbi:MAG: hypothetical protein LBT07_02160, partial [Endomicrobium sp.]|nr:hypothetical protein [Endomicrobium sp.]
MENTQIQWHPLFIEAMKIGLDKYCKESDFLTEHQLTSGPLHIDAVVILRDGKVIIEEGFAKNFRRHNILEYKSPKDYTSVRDFYKVGAYALLYLHFSKEIINEKDVLITIFQSRYPQALMEHLANNKIYE